MFAILQEYTWTVSKSGHAFALNIAEQWQYFAKVMDQLWNEMIDSFFFFLLTYNWCHEQ